MHSEINKGQYLTFMIEGKCYGINVKYVTEIVSMQNITHVPEMPYYIKGIINLRGTIIPVMDTRLRFGLQEKDYNERSCIIVLNIEDIDIGIVIDEVAEVITIYKDDLVKLPEGYHEDNAWVERIIEVEGEIKILIDSYKLIGMYEEGQLVEEQNEMVKES